jgi:hypothetical protein
MDFDENGVRIRMGGGFFSCCSCRLDAISTFIRKSKRLPDYVDSSPQFKPYRETPGTDVTFVYFKNYNDINVDISFVDNNFYQRRQWDDYNILKFDDLSTLMKKYFSLTDTIVNIKNEIENKYNIDYSNTCVVFLRGNDKRREKKIADYETFITKSKEILQKEPKIQFLIQSDETEFIETMQKEFPNNSFYFKDEIRHISQANTTVDVVFRNTNHEYSKNFLAITYIMSQCKYVICNSGNCSLWVVLYRNNMDNVIQLR